MSSICTEYNDDLGRYLVDKISADIVAYLRNDKYSLYSNGWNRNTDTSICQESHFVRLGRQYPEQIASHFGEMRTIVTAE